MHFRPVVLQNVFSEKDRKLLRALIDSSEPDKDWLDKNSNRGVKKFKTLETYFSKKLEPLAKKVFSDKTLKTTYSVYLDYNKPSSSLVMHKDQNACVYTIDYCVSAKVPWGVVVEGEEFMFGEGEALAFMGGDDLHGRNPMPDPESNRVEVIMFHFCPEDHWYFTEGPDYVYKLAAEGKLPTF
jgi:hypothetical protein